MSKPTIPLTPGRYYHIYNRGINSCPIFHEDSDHEHFLDLYGKYAGQVADTFAWVLMRTHFHFLVRIKEDMVYRYTMEEIKSMEASQHANAGRSGIPARPSRDATGFSNDATTFSEDKLAFAKWETICIRDAGKQDSGSARRNSGTSGPEFCGKRLPDVCGKTPNPTAHFGHLFNAYARYFNLKYHRHGSLLEHRFKRKLIKDDWYRRNVVVYIHKNPEHHGYNSDFREYPWSSYHSCINEQPGIINRKEVLEWFGNKDNFTFAHKKKMNIQPMEKWLEE